MLNDEICKLREQLNNSIINGQDYEETYKLSTKLDMLIAEYYKVKIPHRREKAREERKMISK